MNSSTWCRSLATFGLLVVAAGTAQSQGNQSPTLKDRLDKAVTSATLDPLANADTDMKHVLDALKDLDPKPIETLSAVDARKQPSPADAVKEVLKKQGKSTAPEPGVTTKNISIPGPGGAIPARVYTPENAAPGGAMPIVVYYHGGGFVIADLDTYDSSPRAIAKMANVVVVSSHYRQAPEHKFPASHEDALAAYKWVLQNGGSLGGDPKRVAVMGESAGGNLALDVAMAARDGNLQVPYRQVLVYPVAGVDTNTPSYQENEKAKPLNKAAMEWFFDKELKSAADKQDPRLDIVGKANLRGLPPTTMIMAQIDPLRSEGETLAAKLQQAGVPVEQKTYSGVTHEFFGMGAVVAKAKEAEAFAAEGLKNGGAGSASGGNAMPGAATGSSGTQR